MKVSRAVEIVADMYGVGKTRVKVKDPSAVEEAMTREDLRILVEKGVIEVLPKRSPSRHRARYKQAQRRKGRRRGHGSRKGRKSARVGNKKKWITKIRAIRRFLKTLRASGKIDAKQYRRIYLLAKGGYVRSRKHVLELIGGA